MAIVQSNAVSLTTLLRLGRVSNVPTVWTNVLAASVLASGTSDLNWRSGIAALAMSLFYIGGMYLNDYFDRAIDARERAERPIPVGEVSESMVALMGGALLGIGTVLLATTGLLAGIVGIGLASVIVAYDAFHKGNPIAPIVMGLCRALVYAGTAATVTGSISMTVIIAAAALLAYVAGITYAARQESLDQVSNMWPLVALSAPIWLSIPAMRYGVVAVFIVAALIAVVAFAVYLLAKRAAPGDVSRAVGLLIAAISLVDAAFLATAGEFVPACVAILGCLATLVLQKYIAGT